MSTVRFCSDTHFGHENMAIKRGFKSIEDHDDYIVKMWNTIVNKKDITYILGDITMEKTDGYKQLDRLNGRIKVILGNHDKCKHVTQLLNHVESVSGMTRYKGLFLSHCPIHERELEFRVPYNIHGHLHEANIMITDIESREIFRDSRYICVSMEQINYSPKSIGELIPNWDDSKYRNKYLLELKKKIEATKGKMFEDE